MSEINPLINNWCSRALCYLENVGSHLIEAIMDLRLWCRPEAEGEHKLVLSRSQIWLLVLHQSGQCGIAAHQLKGLWGVLPSLVAPYMNYWRQFGLSGLHNLEVTLTVLILVAHLNLPASNQLCFLVFGLNLVWPIFARFKFPMNFWVLQFI